MNFFFKAEKISRFKCILLQKKSNSKAKGLKILLKNLFQFVFFWLKCMRIELNWIKLNLKAKKCVIHKYFSLFLFIFLLLSESCKKLSKKNHTNKANKWFVCWFCYLKLHIINKTYTLLHLNFFFFVVKSWFSLRLLSTWSLFYV